MSRQLLLFKLENTGLLSDGTTERLLVAQHSIEDGEELSHASYESYFLEFASFQQLPVLLANPSGTDQNADPRLPSQAFVISVGTEF